MTFSLGIGLQSNGSFLALLDASPPVVSMTGLSNGMAAYDGFGDVGAILSTAGPILTYRWGDEIDGAQFGTGPTPQNYNAAAGQTLYLTVTISDGSLQTSAPIAEQLAPEIVLSEASYIDQTLNVTTSHPDLGEWHWAQYPATTTQLASDGAGGWSQPPINSGVLPVGAASVAITTATSGTGGTQYKIAFYQRIDTTESQVLALTYTEPFEQPVFTAQPSISPAIATVGDMLTFDLGAADHADTYEIEVLTLDGVDKTGEVTGTTWATAGEGTGTIILQTRATGQAGSTLSNTVTSSLSAPVVTADSAVIHTTTYSENTDTWTIETDKPNQGTWHWARYADETTGITPDGSGGWSSAPQESGTIAVGASGAALVIPETGPEGAKYELFIYQRTGTEDSNVLTVGYFVPLSRVPFVPTDYIASAKVLSWHDWRNAAQLRKTGLFATNDTPTTTGDTIYGVRDSSGNSRDLYDESATLLSTWDQEKEQTTLNSTIGWRMRNNFDATSGYEFHVSIKTADDQFMILSHQAPNWAGVVGVGDDSADVDSNMGSPVYYKNGVAIASPTRDILSTEYSTDTALAMGVSGLSFASASFSPKVLGYTDTNYALTGAVVTHTLFTAPLTATERDDISAALLLDAPENTA